jgi:hypothetical protein
LIIELEIIDMVKYDFKAVDVSLDAFDLERIRRVGPGRLSTIGSQAWGHSNNRIT